MLSDATPEDTDDLEEFGERARHGLPALRRHHGHHRHPAGARQGARAPTCGWASTRSPVLHALADGRATGRSSRGCSGTGRPTASCWTGRSRSSAADGSIDHARRAVTAEVAARDRPRRAAPGGRGQARADPARRGSWPPAAARSSRHEPAARLRARIRARENLHKRGNHYYGSYGVVLAVADRGGRPGRRGLRRRPAHRPPPSVRRQAHHLRVRHRSRWARAGPRARSATTSTGSCS